jgi:lysophospholipase L1-like esterase
MKQLFLATFLVATVTSLMWSQEPIRERIEWADIWVTDADKSDLPRVLLIGDSITRGYFDGVEKQLAGKAYCARLTTSKCVADPSFLDEVQLLLKQYRFAVVHFNNGLHGFGYTEEQYRTGLSALLEVLAKHSHNAKLIWATSTPMRIPNNLGQVAETTERVKVRNRIAAELLRDRGIVTNDLYGLVEQHQEYFSGDGVHFNETGRELQAKQVAEAVLACLPGATASLEPAK